MMPRGNPYGMDDETTQRVIRSFLVVRMVRGGLLLVALGLIFVGVEADRWPTVVAVAVGVALLVQATALVANCRRYARIAAISGERGGAGRAGRGPRRPGLR